jgi:hypothetical protein
MDDGDGATITEGAGTGLDEMLGSGMKEVGTGKPSIGTQGME